MTEMRQSINSDSSFPYPTLITHGVYIGAPRQPGYIANITALERRLLQRGYVLKLLSGKFVYMVDTITRCTTQFPLRQVTIRDAESP